MASVCTLEQDASALRQLVRQHGWGEVLATVSDMLTNDGHGSAAVLVEQASHTFPVDYDCVRTPEASNA